MVMVEVAPYCLERSVSYVSPREKFDYFVFVTPSTQVKECVITNDISCTRNRTLKFFASLKISSESLRMKLVILGRVSSFSSNIQEKVFLLKLSSEGNICFKLSDDPVFRLLCHRVWLGIIVLAVLMVHGVLVNSVLLTIVRDFLDYTLMVLAHDYCYVSGSYLRLRHPSSAIAE
ncbi:hypothetical protein Tco_1412289, partial [Tanacetum coccineum]